MNDVAIITGASRGIGAATALLLAKNGFDVCVNYNSSKEQAEDIVKLIREDGKHAIAVKANMGIEAEIIQLFKIVDGELGPVSALVNNAGINGGVCEVEHITTEKLQTVFATNVFGTIIAAREALKRMKPMERGSIVNISSEAAKFGGTKLTHYAAAKAAINTFTIGFAREVAKYNIRVNSVSPGVIDTPIHASSSPERINALLKSLPMGRMGSVNEVAQLILWLLSQESSYVSGAILPITGAR